MIVVDLGNGTLAALQSNHDPFALDALLFSHLHPDHCSDFSALTVLRRYHPAPPRDSVQHKLPVYGPAEAPRRFAAAYVPTAEEMETEDFGNVFTFHSYPTTPFTIAGFTVTATQVEHPCEAYALRIERNGRSLCYTGDSGPCEALERIAAGADTLLGEASWTDAPGRPPKLHLSGKQAGELAAKAGVGRLLVTHVPPWTNRDAVFAEALAAFPGKTELAKEGSTYRI